MNKIPVDCRPDIGDRQDGRNDNFLNIYRYPVYDRSAFQADATLSLYDWWMTFQPGAPAWEDFDIVLHGGYASNIYLIKVLGTDNYEYRLNGDQVARLVGNTKQGVKFTLDDDLPSRRTLAAYCHEICESKAPRRCDGTLMLPDRGETAFESLDCPLISDNGEVTHIIGAIAALSD